MIFVINAGIGEYDDYREKTQYVMVGRTKESLKELYQQFRQEQGKEPYYDYSERKSKKGEDYFEKLSSPTKGQSDQLKDFTAWLIKKGFDSVNFEVMSLDNDCEDSYGNEG